MKQIIIILVIFLIIYKFFNYSLAQGLDFPAQRIPPDINCGQDFFKCLAFFFDKILKVIIALALASSAIFIAWAGILYIIQGNTGAKDKDIHKRITWASFGLIVALLAYAFVKMLEFWITNVKI